MFCQFFWSFSIRLVFFVNSLNIKQTSSILSELVGSFSLNKYFPVYPCVPVHQACCTCWPLTLIMLGALVPLGLMVLAWLVLSKLLGVVQKVDAAHVEVCMNA